MGAWFDPLHAPNGNSLGEYRENLLNGRSGVEPYEIRYVGKTIISLKARLANQVRLRELNRDHRNELEVFCAHDPVYLGDGHASSFTS